MQNTMDSIKVRFGYRKDGSAEEKTLPDFLGRSGLNADERRIQEACRILYQLNENNHLFKDGFQPLNGKSLVIDSMVVPDPDSDKEKMAVYDMERHEIIVYDTPHKDPVNLAVIMAHELMHVRQNSKEFLRIFQNANAFQRHQYGYLQEAQAKVFEERVAFLLNHPLGQHYGEKKMLSQIFGEYSEEKIEQERMNEILPNLYQSSYKDEYDSKDPILENDSPLTEILPVFHATPEIRRTLEKAPRQARTVPNRIKQALVNQQPEKIAGLLKSKDKNGQEIMTADQIDELCCSLLMQPNKNLKQGLVHILLAKDENGQYIVGNDTVNHMLIRKAQAGDLSDLEQLFKEKDSNGNKRIPQDDFERLSQRVQNQEDILIQIMTSRHPKKQQANLDLLQRVRGQYEKTLTDNLHRNALEKLTIRR